MLVFSTGRCGIKMWLKKNRVSPIRSEAFFFGGSNWIAKFVHKVWGWCHIIPPPPLKRVILGLQMAGVGKKSKKNIYIYIYLYIYTHTHTY